MKMQYSVLLLFLIILQTCTAPPVTKNKSSDNEDNKVNEVDGKETGLVSLFLYLNISHVLKKIFLLCV